MGDLYLVLPSLNQFNLDGGWHFDNCSTRKIDDVLLKQGGLLHVLPLPVHLTIRILIWWVGAVSGWVGRVDGPKDFSVSPSPFGLGLAWRLRRDLGQYLTIIFRRALKILLNKHLIMHCNAALLFHINIVIKFF